MRNKIRIILSMFAALAMIISLPIAILSNSRSNNSLNLTRSMSESAVLNTNENIETNNNQPLAVTDNLTLFSSPISNSRFAVVKNMPGSDRLYGWGRNENSQLGFTSSNTSISVPTLVSIPNLTAGDRITAVYSSLTFTALVVNQKDLYFCGYNEFGQFGFGTEGDSFNTFTKLNFAWDSNIKQVAVGVGHVIVLTTNNTIYSCGNNVEGELGLGNDMNKYATFQRISIVWLGTVHKIGATNKSSWAWVSNDSLFTWGSSSVGQLGLPGIKKISVPTRVTFPPSFDKSVISQITSSQNNVYVVFNKNNLYAWGQNNFNQVNYTSGHIVDMPSFVRSTNSAMRIVSLTGSSLIFLDTGIYYGLGYNGAAEFGIGFANFPNYFTQIPNPAFKSENDQIAGSLHSTMIIADSKIYGWGTSEDGVFGDGNRSLPILEQKTEIFPFRSPNDLVVKTGVWHTTTAGSALATILGNGILNMPILKNYVNGFESFYSPNVFSISGTPKADDSKGTIQISIHASLAYSNPDGAKSLNGIIYDLTLTNFQAPTSVVPNENRNTEQSASEAYTDLSTNFSFEKLQLYTNIFGQHSKTGDGISIHQNGITNPTNNKTGELKFNVSISNYHNSSSTPVVNTPTNFLVTLQNFIKDSTFSTNPSAEDLKMSAKQAYNSFADSTGIITDKTKFEKYINVSGLDSRTSIISVSYDKDKANSNGEIILTINCNKYYVNGKLNNAPKQTVLGFIADTTFNAIAPGAVPIKFSPNVVYRSFANSDGTVKSRETLEKYVDLTNWDDRTKITKINPTPNYNNGSLKLSVDLEFAYKSGDPIFSLETTILNLSPDIIIDAKNESFEISASEALASFTDSDDNINQENIGKYVDIKSGSPTITSIISRNVDDFNGCMTIEMTLSNAYKDGEEVGNLELPLSGFIKNSAIVGRFANFNISSTEVVDEINTAVREKKDVEAVLNKYVMFLIDNKTKIDFDSVSAIVEKDESGNVISPDQIILTFNNLEKFYELGKSTESTNVLVNGFAIQTEVVKKTTNNSYKQTAKQAISKLPIGVELGYELLTPYLDFIDIPHSAKVIITRLDSDNENGVINLKFKLTNYYKNGVLIQEEQEFPIFRIDGFSVRTDWWIYTLAAIGGISAIVLFVYLLILKKKPKSKDPTVDDVLSSIITSTSKE